MQIKSAIYKGIQLLSAALLLLSGVQSFARNAQSEFITTTDTITKGKYTLVFINQDSAFNTAIQQRMIDAFFLVYPKQSEVYNPNTSKVVTFIIDTAYKGVAATSGDVVHYNPQWFVSHPQDIDVVTHEVMHIVQAYPESSGPGWITEGIADYARYRYGVDNAGANWQLTPFSDQQHFDNSYRITARFFVWIEQHYDQNFVQSLDKAMREQQYTPAFAKQKTGKTFGQLWDEYKKNPEIR